MSTQIKISVQRTIDVLKAMLVYESQPSYHFSESLDVYFLSNSSRMLVYESQPSCYFSESLDVCFLSNKSRVLFVLLPMLRLQLEITTKSVLIFSVKKLLWGVVSVDIIFVTRVMY